MAGEFKPSTIRGELNTTGMHFGIVVSQFNSFITDRLLAGALDALQSAGAAENQIEIVVSCFSHSETYSKFAAYRPRACCKCK